MDESMMAAIMSKLTMDGSSPEAAIEKLQSMKKQEQMEIITSAMMGGNSAFSMFGFVKQTVKAKPNVPLAKIRDREKPFNNYLCMGCGKGDQTFLTCSRCKSVKYCSKDCQVKDWIGKGSGLNSRKHKLVCNELIEANKEFASHPTAGVSLRTKVFSSWANQHHEDGSFFLHEFLARKNLLGGAEVGYWALPDVATPYHEKGKDRNGFQHGYMMLAESFPAPKDGWTCALKENEYPDLSCPPPNPVPKEGLRGWEDYMKLRGLVNTSVAPLLLTNVLTVYQMIFHELKLLNQTKKKFRVYLLGVEAELSQLPLFGELAYLLPTIDLELILVSPAAKAICDEARSHKKSLLARATDKCVVDTSDSTGKCRVRVKLEPNHAVFDDVPNYPRPDAVLGLNAGLGTYPAWRPTMHKLLRMKVPFCFSDHTRLILDFVQQLWLPAVVESANRSYSEYGRLSVPSVQSTLNPFHGIVGRDAAYAQSPTISNGYIMSWRPGLS